MLYNGQNACPEHSVLKLSDAFKNTAGFRSGEGPALELVVYVYNINQG